jgi:hypothetical protein
MNQSLQKILNKIFNKTNILFVAGLLGVYYETRLATTVNLELLILFASMMGLPAFFSPTGYGKKDKEHKEDE